jgi:SpoVK/Ycf46/Vps4 family AAA+-type ATPase
VGSPGTGKTITARHYASIIQSLGVLEKGHLVEVSKTDLIGRYVGDTEEITSRVFHSALDGILFIDEAHLIEPSYPWSYDQELVSTLLKLMEDFRKRIIIIFAGYEAGIHKNLYQFEGMKSRIPFEIEFKDYSAHEMTEIFFHFCEKDNILIDKNLFGLIEKSLRQYPRQSNITLNAREVRNMYENLLIKRAKRVAQIKDPSDDDLRSIIEEDLHLIFPNPDNNVIKL